jgi:DnaK suppressor protein
VEQDVCLLRAGESICRHDRASIERLADGWRGGACGALSDGSFHFVSFGADPCFRWAGAALDWADTRQTRAVAFFGVNLGKRGLMEGSGLKKKDLKRFREVLLARKREILRNAQRTLSEDMTLETDDLPDEMDLASSEYLQSFTFRLRGREKTFLQKIDHALERIDDGSFGLCEQCGEPISLKRLEARLETTLCIRCKEDQERMEKAYG